MKPCSNSRKNTEEAKAQVNTAQTDIQRDMHKQTAAIYLTRRQKCLEAIETLEEYLAFKEVQESAVKNKIFFNRLKGKNP